MKSIILATGLAMVSTFTYAEWEDVWQNPDLDPKFGAGYDMDFAPVVTSGERITGLQDFYRGNPDVSTDREAPDQLRGMIDYSQLTASSLDVFNSGNPDQYDGRNLNLGIQSYDSEIRAIGDETQRY